MSDTESANAAEGTCNPGEGTPSIEWLRDFMLRWQDAVELP